MSRVTLRLSSVSCYDGGENSQHWFTHIQVHWLLWTVCYDWK